MEIQAGKSYVINYPNSGRGARKVHIDAILDNPTIDEKYRTDPEYQDYMLIVYRVWIKHKRYWHWYVDPYYVLCMWNDWKWHKPEPNKI